VTWRLRVLLPRLWWSTELVHFEASFVPRASEFWRLDARFRLSDEVWRQLPAYQDFGFIPVILRFARRRGATEIEWLVFATNCARPNPRLRPILEARGFVVRDVPDRGFCYYRRDKTISGDDSKSGADAG
jgi:hypothetical protein